MNFDIEKIIKDVEIKSTLLIDMDYLEIIIDKTYVGFELAPSEMQN